MIRRLFCYFLCITLILVLCISEYGVADALGYKFTNS